MANNIIDFHEKRRDKSQEMATALIKIKDEYYAFNEIEAHRVERVRLEAEEADVLFMCTNNYIKLGVEDLKRDLKENNTQSMYNMKENIERTKIINNKLKDNIKDDQWALDLNFWDLKALSLAVKSNLDLYRFQFGEEITDTITFRSIKSIETRLDQMFIDKMKIVIPGLGDEIFN